MKTRVAAMAGMLLMFLAVGLMGLAWAGDAAKDKKKLQGTWLYEKGEKKGSLQFKGDKFTVTMHQETYKGTFTIDPTKKPATIDMTVKEGDRYKGQTSLGIYKIEGDKLTWCANEPGKDARPREFSEKQGDMKFLLVVARRQKK